MSTLSIGLIGYGYSGATFHAPTLAVVDGLSLDAIVTRRPERAGADWPQARLYRNPEALLEDPAIDLVVITSPNTLHYAQTRAALEAGKHVVVEKPFTLASSEAEALDRLAQARGLTLCPYHNRRWDGDFLTLSEIVKGGRLGWLHTFESRIDRYRPQVRDRWREQDLPGSGVLYDLGPHLIDQALVLFGPPETVWADLRVQRPGAVTDDSFHLLLGYPQRRVVLEAGMLVAAPTPRFVLHGRHGSFVKYGVDPQEAALKVGRRPDEPDWGRDDPALHGTLILGEGGAAAPQHVTTRSGRYQAYYRELAAALREGRPPPVSAAQARDVIRLIELARASQREGRRMAWDGAPRTNQD